MIVYLARVIPAVVMYCVNGASRSSLLIESTDTMILWLLLFVKSIFGYRIPIAMHSRDFERRKQQLHLSSKAIYEANKGSIASHSDYKMNCSA